LKAHKQFRAELWRNSLQNGPPTPDEEIQETSLPSKEDTNDWIMYFDGAFMLQGADASVLLVAPIGEHLKYVIQIHFPREQATNNTAEYEGLLAGLWIAVDLGIRKLIIRGDSQLVVRQVNKNYQSPLMEAYVDEVRKLEQHFDGLQMEHIPRTQNDIVDDLSKRATKRLPVEPGTFVQQLTQPSVTQSTNPAKRRKANTGNYFPTDLPADTGEPSAGNKSTLAGEQQAPAGSKILVVETSAPADKEQPLVLVVKPQAPAWAQ
jgi:ribonuclease HI